MSDLREALIRSITAIDDWLNVYASDFCNSDRVDEAQRRISDEGGTLSYIANVQQKNRTALAQPEAVELVFLGSPDHKAVAARLRGYANDPMWADHGEVPKSLLFEAAQLLTAPPLAPDERMHRALVDAVCEIDEAVSLAGSAVAAMHKVQDELKALSRADEGKESEGGEPDAERTQRRLAVSDDGLGPMQVIPREPPSGPSDHTPQDAQRQAIARIIDPEAFQNGLRKDGVSVYWFERRAASLTKADAIIALQTRAGG